MGSKRIFFQIFGLVLFVFWVMESRVEGEMWLKLFEVIQILGEILFILIKLLIVFLAELFLNLWPIYLVCFILPCIVCRHEIKRFFKI